MKILDPGHKYLLNSLDGSHLQELRFVKREGPGYPGNKGSYPGTTMQDVLRALIDRANYVNNQTPCAETEAAMELMRSAVVLLELRAARRHERFLDRPNINSVVKGKICEKCGHIGCEGKCHD